MTPSRHITRRCFHKAAAFAAATLAAPTIVRGRNLNEKMNIAVIGAGGRGAANTAGLSSENIAVLCDVNANAVDAAAVKHPAAVKYTDFRKVFDKPAVFDAVVVSTCEHTHAFATLLALRNNKHVYCEKPLTYNIEEARKVREEAARRKVTTMMGIQMHAGDNYRRVVELIQANVIGPVRQVHVWVSRAWGLQSPEAAKKNDIVAVMDRPKEAEAVPAGLDWELWVGPAPKRPFNSVYVPGPKWYRWWDFGNGTMSDLGSHWNDLPFWALKLQAPLTVEASGPPPHPELAPASMSAAYEYGPRGDLPAVKLVWHQGEAKPDIWLKKGIPQWSDGVLFIGDKGMLLSNYTKHVLLPEKEFAGAKLPDPSLPRVGGKNYAEWIAACKAGKECLANFEYAGWLTEANHLGNVAYRAGKKLIWDAAALRASNVPEAERFIRREYRKGWEL
jgi:predicted dehydrogenase